MKFQIGDIVKHRAYLDAYFLVIDYIEVFRWNCKCYNFYDKKIHHLDDRYLELVE